MPVKRITYVVHQFLPDYFTGTEQYVFVIAKEMQSRGHDVEIFSLDPFFGESNELLRVRREEVSSLKVERIRYWMNSHRDWTRLEYQHPLIGARFGEYLDRRQPDLLHFFHLRHLGGNLIGEARMRDLRILIHLMDFWFICPAVILKKSDGTLCEGPPKHGLGCIECQSPTLHETLVRDGILSEISSLVKNVPSPSLPGKSSVRRAMSYLERPRELRSQLLLADRIFSPSDFLKSQFVANGIPVSRIDVQRYGIDTSEITGRPKSKSSTLRVGYIGTISEHKGLHLLIEAVRGSDANLTLQVHGRTSDFEAYSSSQQEAASRDPRIQFMGPFARETLDAVLHSIDVLVVPSQWYENTPFVILEAQAAKIPVIATDLGGMSEMIRHEIDGELFAVNDSSDLARRLQRLADEPARLARYRQATPEVRTLTNNCDDLESIYLS